MNITTEQPLVPGGAALRPRTPTVHIEATSGWASLGLRELWAYRELLYFIAWREVKIRYKQTIMGAAWAILQPFFTMVVFSLFFGKLAKVPSDNIPYPIFSYTALVPWSLFAHALTNGSNSLIQDARMIKKIYFPRLVIPIGQVMAFSVDFFLAFTVLIGMMLYYRIVPSFNAFWVIYFFLLTVVTGLGASFWLSAMNVQFRDVRYTIPFFSQLWMWLTPIAYPSSLLHEPWRTLYALNPMAGVVDGFRWALLGNIAPPTNAIIVSSIAALVMFITGMYYFRRLEKTFADVV